MSDISDLSAFRAKKLVGLFEIELLLESASNETAKLIAEHLSDALHRNRPDYEVERICAQIFAQADRIGKLAIECASLANRRPA